MSVIYVGAKTILFCFCCIPVLRVGQGLCQTWALASLQVWKLFFCLCRKSLSTRIICSSISARLRKGCGQIEGDFKLKNHHKLRFIPLEQNKYSHTSTSLPGCQASFSTQTNQRLHFLDMKSSGISHGDVATGNGVLAVCLEVRFSPEPETDRAGSARPAV